MTFNIPKDILAPPPPDPHSSSVDESGGRRSRDNPEVDNVVSGDFFRKAFSVSPDLESTSDAIEKREDLQMCGQKRRRQPEPLKNDFARRWISHFLLYLISDFSIFHSHRDFDISHHDCMTKRCTTRILRGVRKRSPDLKKVQIF